jgi:D-lyxose ketol-isomerase
MKRSEINSLLRSASHCYRAHGWALPPNPRWDITDFGLGDWRRYGLVLVNLAEEPEYCEKLMYAQKGMTTPAHAHAKKKEDIICRWGKLAVQVWANKPALGENKAFGIPINHEEQSVSSGSVLELDAGWRVTLVPGYIMSFLPSQTSVSLGRSPRRTMTSTTISSSTRASDVIQASKRTSRLPCGLLAKSRTRVTISA